MKVDVIVVLIYILVFAVAFGSCDIIMDLILKRIFKVDPDDYLGNGTEERL